MTQWLVDTLLMTSALMLLVLLVRRPVGRWFGPAAAYALWALPLIRFFLPPLVLPEQAVVPPLAPALTETFSAEPVAALADALPPEAAVAILPPEPVSQIPWLEIALVVWLGGAALFLLHRVIGYRAMRRDLLRDARQVGRSGKVRIVESPAVSAPLAFGVFDKVVALPAGFLANTDSDASDFAIAHELEHHAANDLAANIAVQPLFALHWFNPIAWLAWRALRSDQEAACDARVVKDCDRAERERYGRLIASFAAGPRLALAAPMAGVLRGEKPIIHRLKALVRNDVSERRRFLGRSLFAAAVIGVPMTATITYAAVEEPMPEDPVAPLSQVSPVAPVAPLTPLSPVAHDQSVEECAEDHDHALDRQASATEARAEREDRRARAEADREGLLAEAAAEREGRRAEAEAARVERHAELMSRNAERMAAQADAHARRAEQMAERHAADAERRAAEAERMGERAARMAPDVEEWTSPDGSVQKISIVSKDANGNRRSKQTMVIDSNCAAGSRSQTAQVRAVAGGSVSETRVCTGAPDVSRHVVVAFQQARASVAANRSIPASVRSEILANFDEQIAEARAEAR